MPTKQYLFRLHHNPIFENGPRWTDMLEDDFLLTHNQLELHHSDFLVSLPETSPDLIQQADMLAYAQAIITIRAPVWAVAVFQLSDSQDADNTTPVIVLHPYRDFKLAPKDISNNPDDRYFPAFNYPGYNPLDPELNNYGLLGSAFASYALHTWPDQQPYQYFPDPWVVAVVARNRERGRTQLQFIKKAIDWTDYFTAADGGLVLHDKGTLARTRFPLWKTAIESLPYGHSGYAFNRQGRLSAQPIALSTRVLNGVSNMAQQRRMFIRRNYAISTIMTEWFITGKKMMAWFWWNDHHGWATPLTFSWGYVPYGWAGDTSGMAGNLTATDVPWPYLAGNLQFVIDFLNLVNVAQGDTGLIISLPGKSAVELEQQYQDVLNRLRDSDGVVRRYAVRNLTTHHEILRHMVDLVAHIIGEIMDYRTAFQQWNETPNPQDPPGQLQRAAAGVQIVNDFAVKWTGLVTDFYSVMCLIFSWQLTWDVAEPTRAPTGEAPIRNRETPYRSKANQYLAYLPKKFPPVQLDPQNDFGSRRPQFAPYRTWDVELYDSGFEEQYAGAQAEQRRQAAQQYFTQLAQEQLAREQASRAAQAAYLADWKAERQRRQDANPDDVWDYRNFSSLDWWKQKAQEPMSVEFALRSINIPNELLNPYDFGLGLARNYIPAFNRHSDANGWNESNQPGAEPLQRIAYSPLTVLVSRLVGGVPTNIAITVVGDAAGDLADYLGENDETYSPRQFWPPIAFSW